ncbi:efflux RND transporter periplasmic adaptor subunit [Chitinophaga varians]|uniref:efflux RND transporter periplasmic adaptor subunit n=1 Tax=Chitinophaga varians TaxID=2202339 RepID=UPI00165ECCFF|nr:efflux RND transporter periplasmic adaptor subunit [Chitinophaga varians]MBC9911126.1 efflux RND transporter periplasmic adaptor subunit [Chitinophaga varians]
MLRLLLAGIVLMPLLSMSCRNASADQKHTASPKQYVEPDNITAVKVLVLHKALFSYYIESSGKIKAKQKETIHAEQSGPLRLCNVWNNKMLDAGETVIAFDQRAISLRRERATEEHFNAAINYKSELLNQASLLESKSQQIRDTVYHKLKANTGLTNAELTLKELTLELEKMTIRAPFKGIAADVKVQQGSTVRAGDELFTIYTAADLYLEANILESDFSMIKAGQPATLQTVSGSRHNAVVTETNPIVDDNGMMLVKLRIIDHRSLVPGMNAMAKMAIPLQQVLAVPKEAVVMRSGKAVVFTVQQNQAKWQYVKTGRDNGTSIEITEGLKDGDSIIISNNVQLTHNSTVSIIR